MNAFRSLAEGKPLRIPLHAALVHLPIGLFPLSLLMDAAGWWWRSGNFPASRAAFVCLVAGIASGVFAAIFGFVDYTAIRRDHPAKKTATLHMVLNVAAIAIFAVSATLRWNALDVSPAPLAPVALSLVGLALLGYSGYLGGDLSYNDGIGVGRHRRDTTGPHATTIVRAPPTQVAVAGEDALAEGETLRVDVNGTIIAVARVQGQLCAFQEFCTHRYGPLSEGKIDGCEVICPWHRSRFDLRTGKVTHGPAKIDLRTFRVEAHDGKIWIDAPARPV